MDRVNRVLNIVRRMSPRKRERGYQGDAESPETCEDGLCSLSLCIGGGVVDILRMKAPWSPPGLGVRRGEKRKVVSGGRCRCSGCSTVHYQVSL
ncbi:hypothetical protein AALO_G00139260 [Alosa alosa]|uniref:Uncharacterized protein n=1 Tax=Alosa alosa TaxID=278164 RepID=A0AAV6GIR9_9TELE|nr:hypothetical protein AALO_G00139260 [Alosa alosa]